ncbi:unnamed protein product [Lymnaea stagnalis]|uniref:Kazal-like domain-containing protein n=1 Tax=Lymnaea stagnalis TaxID=6523 RepID=A0AAV2HFP8_LYMST
MYQERCISNLPLNNENIIKGKCPRDNPVPSNGSGLPPLPTSCDDPTICSALAPPPPGIAEGPVCGPSNAESPKSYPTYCDMVKAVCKSSGGPTSLPRDSAIKASPGECGKGNGPPKPQLPPSEPIFTPWSPYSQCLFTDKLRNCGEGTQVKNRQVAPYDDFRPVRQVEPYETGASRPCFVACVNILTGAPEGLCPEQSLCNEVDPVCGSLGAGAAKEFKSECELNISACQASKVPHKLYSGSCDPEDGSALRRYCEEAGPVQVAVKYDIEKDGEHCVGEPVTIGSCGDLLCEGEAGTCCKATKFEQIQVDVQCYSLSTKQPISQIKHVYISAIECQCQAGSP